MPDMHFEIQRRIKSVSFPEVCVIAVFCFSNPWQVVHDSNGRRFVFNPVDQCFYTMNPNNAVRCEWVRARGMDAWLASARKYFDDLFLMQSLGGDR